MSPPEAFSLLSLPRATLTAHGTTENGPLNLECITLPVPDASAPVDRDVYLLLRLGSIEAPIDPVRIIQRVDKPGWQSYNFLPSQNDQSHLELSLPVDGKDPQHYLEDLETFESLLSQYAELRLPNRSRAPSPAQNPVLPSPEKSDLVGSALPGAHGDLRGHLVAINEDTGEVIGQFDDSQFRIHEDPKLQERGHENDAVMIEVPDNRSGAAQDATALQMFAAAVPPEERDIITKSAGIVSHAISTTTNLLLTTITTASNYYVSHSKPSPHHPSEVAKRGPDAPPPPPSRTLVFLTSEKTRRGFAGVHAVSGKAVQVSAKTVNMVDGMIRRAMGGKPKKGRMFAQSAGHRDDGYNHGYTPTPGGGSGVQMLSPNPSYHGSGASSPFPRAPSPGGSTKSGLDPPPYYAGDQKSLRSPSPAGNAPPIPPRTFSGAPPGSSMAGPSSGAPPLPPRKPLSKGAKVLLSLDLILSTIDHDTRRLLDGGTHTVGKVVGHKYGQEAAESSLLLAGSARNVGLVYVDMRGIGRRALLKRAGKHWVKARYHPGHRQGEEGHAGQQGYEQSGQGSTGTQGERWHYTPPPANSKN